MTLATLSTIQRVSEGGAQCYTAGSPEAKQVAKTKRNSINNNSSNATRSSVINGNNSKRTSQNKMKETRNLKDNTQKSQKTNNKRKLVS